jgi:copper chaperone CopZ
MPEIIVKGMSCSHCAQALTKALTALPGVSGVTVDLATGKVAFTAAAPVAPEDVARAVTAAGFELAG